MTFTRKPSPTLSSPISANTLVVTAMKAARSAMVKNTEILTVSVVLGSIKDGNTADSNPNISTAGSNNSHVQILKKGPYL